MPNNQKLRISLLLPNKGIGGGVRSTARVGNELLLLGHDVRIFYRNDLSGLQNKLRRVYIKLRYGSDNDWLKTFKGNSFVYNRLDSHDFSADELIVSMCSRTTLDMSQLPENIGIKVFHCRGSEIGNREQLLKAWNLPIPKIALSSHLAESIKREANQSVIGVVPNGVDTEEYFPCVPEWERTGIGAYLGWSKSKDPARTIQVMQMLEKSLPNVSLYLFSGGTRPKGINNIIFKRFPSVDEARRIYSSCKVWFCTSLSEGFGNPLLEAMACGCAVVSTKCGGPSDIIQDGQNGFLVDVGNAKRMVDKIVLLYKHEQRRRQICKYAMKAVQKFTWPKAVSKLEEYLYLIYEMRARPKKNEAGKERAKAYD